MESSATKFLQFSLSWTESRGFTILEFVISSFLGVSFIGMVLASVISNRSYFKEDIVRTRLNENERGALDIIGADVRLAGENLGSAFPAIELVDGASGASDTLFIRRSLISEVLPVCVAIAAGSTANLQFAIAGNVAGCTYSGQTTNYNAWRTYRTDNDNTVDAYIWDSVAKQGEFFQYVNEEDTGVTYAIARNGTWQNNYPIGSSAAYILEEWQFQHALDELRLVTNSDAANPQTLAFDVKGFQITVTMMDGTTKTALTTADSWTQIRLIQPVLTASDTFAGEEVERSLTGNYFPRNVLSN